MSKVVCEICPHSCALEEGQTGICRARENIGGRVVSLGYGKLTSIALDPIEKKPLRRFYPGSMILSVGSFGCNLKCSFCQNHRIATAGSEYTTVYMAPEELAHRAQMMAESGNIGVAFTYNEPLVGYEYVMDAARAVQERGMKTVLVTNGYINEAPLLALLPHVDAMNIDLKAFDDKFYRRVGGDLETVKRTIKLSAAVCHVEVTALIIPGLNDADDDMRRMAGWLGGISDEIPLHVSRFFPQYKMTDRPPTPVKTIYRLADIARGHLKYVYEGNC